jgi:hypothetical protein
LSFALSLAVFAEAGCESAPAASGQFLYIACSNLGMRCTALPDLSLGWSSIVADSLTDTAPGRHECQMTSSRAPPANTADRLLKLKEGMIGQ